MRRVVILLASALALYAGIVACSSDDAGEDPSVDLPPLSDAEADSMETGAVDAGPVAKGCSPDTPFGAPALVPGVSSATDDYGAHLTADELTIFFARAVPDAGLDLFAARRTSRDAGFGLPTPFALLDTPADDNYPTVTGDGLTLVFERSAANGLYRLYITTRANVLDDFGPPRELNELLLDGGGYSIGQPSILGDGSELYFISLASGGYDIVRATRTADGGFSPPVTIPELTTMTADLSPAPSADGLVIYFGSRRGNTPVNKPYVATRAKRSDPFGPVRPVTELASADPLIADVPTWISPDLCRVYLVSTRLGPAHVFVAERAPK